MLKLMTMNDFDQAVPNRVGYKHNNARVNYLLNFN